MDCTMAQNIVPDPIYFKIKGTEYGSQYIGLRTVLFRDWCGSFGGQCPRECERIVIGCIEESKLHTNFLGYLTIRLRMARTQLVAEKAPPHRTGQLLQAGEYGNTNLEV